MLIDGVPIRACTPFTDSLTGRHIITVEGLTDEEKKLYTYAYGEAGAVQCGFCIPGMVLCTKALLDQNLNPTDDQIRYAPAQQLLPLHRLRQNLRGGPAGGKMPPGGRDPRSVGE